MSTLDDALARAVGIFETATMTAFRNSMMRGIPFARRSVFDWSDVGEVPAWVGARARGGWLRASDLDPRRGFSRLQFETARGVSIYEVLPADLEVESIVLGGPRSAARLLRAAPDEIGGQGFVQGTPIKFAIFGKRIILRPTPDGRNLITVTLRERGDWEPNRIEFPGEQAAREDAERARFGGRTRAEFERAAALLRQDQEDEVSQITGGQSARFDSANFGTAVIGERTADEMRRLAMKDSLVRGERAMEVDWRVGSQSPLARAGAPDRYEPPPLSPVALDPTAPRKRKVAIRRTGD